MLANTDINDLDRLVKKLNDLKVVICGDYTKIMNAFENYRGSGEFASKVKETSGDIMRVCDNVDAVLGQLSSILVDKKKSIIAFDQDVKNKIKRTSGIEGAARTMAAGASILSSVDSGIRSTKDIFSTTGGLFSGANNSASTNLDLNGLNSVSTGASTSSSSDFGTSSNLNPNLDYASRDYSGNISGYGAGIGGSDFEPTRTSYSGGYSGLYGSSAGLGSSADLFEDTSAGSNIPTMGTSSGLSNMSSDGSLNMANQGMDSGVDTFDGSYGSYGNLSSAPSMGTTGFNSTSAISNEASGSGWKYAAAGGALVGAAGLAAMLAKKKNSEAENDSDYDLTSDQNGVKDSNQEETYDWNSTPDSNGNFGI